MKPMTFENLRRLMGAGRKKKDKEASFKRSDSFKRISIKKNYLDRGAKKKQKLESANALLFDDETKLEEYNIKKVDACPKAENLYLESPKSLKAIREEIKAVNQDSFESFSLEQSVIVQCQPEPSVHRENVKSKNVSITQLSSPSLRSSDKEEYTKKKPPEIALVIPKCAPIVPEKIIIHVPALEDMPVTPKPVPLPRKSKIARQESNDSAVEMFPWGDSAEILRFDRSPVYSRRRPFQLSPPASPLLQRNDEMCSLSVSLGRIWMDAPQVMSPRSLELPRTPAPPLPAHNSLDSALKANKEDPIVINRLQKNKPSAFVCRTLSSSTQTSGAKTSSSNDSSTYLFSSKDSGVSFSVSVPKLSDFSPAGAVPSSGGFFRRKRPPKPKLSVSRDGYFKRTSDADSNVQLLQRSSRRKKEHRSKKNSVQSEMYTVVVRRPPRNLSFLKLDPMIFVPPEKRSTTLPKNRSFVGAVREIRDYSHPRDSCNFDDDLFDSDEGLYETISGEYATHADVGVQCDRLASFREKADSSSTLSPAPSVTGTSSVHNSSSFTSSSLYVTQPSTLSSVSSCQEEIYGRRQFFYLKNSDLFSKTSEVCASPEYYSDLEEDDSEHSCDDRVPYVPPGVSPVPRRRAVPRRRRSAPRRPAFVTRSAVHRAPSTLRKNKLKKSGDITQKGYEKKKSRLLCSYIPKQSIISVGGDADGGVCDSSGGGAAGAIGGGGRAAGGGAGAAARHHTRTRRTQRRVTHNEKRYHSGGRPVAQSNGSAATAANAADASAAQQHPARFPKGNRRLTRNESRYHSEVRQEAVQQALAAMQNRPKPSLPMPSKRTSVMAKSPDRERHECSSSSDEDSCAGDGDALSNHHHQQHYHGGGMQTGSAGATPERPPPPLPPPLSDASSGAGSPPPRRPLPPPISASRSHAKHHHRRHEMADLADIMHNMRPYTQPDVTHNTASARRSANQAQYVAADRVQQRRAAAPLPALQPTPPERHAAPLPPSSISISEDGHNTGTAGRWKVSAKIQQLLNTLKRPKRRPLPEFYEDDDIELEIAANPKDPNAPKPEGGIMTPAIGEQLVVPSGLPRNLEAALQRYGTASFKANVATVLDPNGKMSSTLTYGKLLSRSHKIAYALLNRTFTSKNSSGGTSGSNGSIDATVKTGDRVALVYPNNDPVNFMCAWYGCLQAGVVPVPIEVPLTRRDAGSQQVGFLLGSCGIRVALTSEACLKGLPKTAGGEVAAFRGWPRLQWLAAERLARPPRDWAPPPRPADDSAAHLEYTTAADGAAMGVTITRSAMISHCRAITASCGYTEGEHIVCVLDFKREVGLWHGVLTSVLNGMHVIFIPYALMKINPASWMHMITKYRASVAVVKSRDLHWGLLATKEHKEVSLSSLRLLLVADGANPWSLSSCDQFLSVFQSKGLRGDAICPCACGSEALTVSIRRPGRGGAGGAAGRGVLSMSGLSYGVVRVDAENSLTSLTLQDCGQVMPGSIIVVVKMDGAAYLCKTDEVGEICVLSGSTGSGYWGLQGLTNTVFKVRPLGADSQPIGEDTYTRSGLLGFLGPGGLVFVCGSRDGLMTVTGRKHNMDDIIATVLAVEPMKFIYRGRIAVFSVRVLRDERICVVAEQRPDCGEEESFQWMSRVLQAVDSIHQVGIYCLALVQPNFLPKTPLGGIHLSECKRRFLEGSLHPANVLMCPHTCVTNLPKPREIHSAVNCGVPADVGPASVIVGNLVQGNRLASAHGRDMGHTDDSDAARKYQFISEILRWRAQSTSDHVIFTLLNAKGAVAKALSCSELHKKAERIGNLLLEKGRVNTGDHVALVFPPGIDLICAFYGCLYVGAVPVTIRPPHPQNLHTTLPTVRMIVDVSKAALILSNQSVIKLLRSREAGNVVDIKSWPMILDTDDMPKKKLPILYRAPTAEMLAYLDFSVSTTGMLAGIKMSHAAVTSLCRSMKLACELYPSRHIALCLDPYCGLGFALWCLSSIYSGHHSILIPPSEVEVNPALWLSAVSQYRVRDTFCSYGVMELCTKGLGSSVNQLKTRGVNLGCVRTCVVVAEERPRINLTTSFSKLFSALGLSPRAVSTSFGCRVNIAICLQGASSPEPSTVYVDLRALRNDRVSLVERGSPHSLCVMESGKLLPGVKVIIANPETKGQCGDSHLGEIWVQSSHNASGYFTIYGDESDYADHFNARLVTGSTGEVYARTGYLGFLRRTEGGSTNTQGEDSLPLGRESPTDSLASAGSSTGLGNVSDIPELHDAVFVVGALDETIMLRGMRYHPIDIENSVLRCHKKIAECAVFTWTNLLVVVVELDGNDSEALNLVPLVTNTVLEEHHLIVGVVVVVDPGVVPINSRGEKQRMHLRDGFLSDQIDAIYIAYNM